MIHQLLLKYVQIVQQNEGMEIFYFILKLFLIFSGLTEGDHIIYIESLNVQKLGSFNEIIRLIHRTFEENDQVTLITLTGPGYQVLRRRGGYLDSIIFDYQLLNIDQMKPRLCKLHLHNHESDFGLTLHRDNSLKTLNKVHQLIYMV
jgi:hypothetical protein